jgi:hypothetical protein
VADMYDCGRYMRKAWREGVSHTVRWLGRYDPAMTSTTANRILEHDGKLTPSACEKFARGWDDDAATSAEVDERLTRELDEERAALTR